MFKIKGENKTKHDQHNTQGMTDLWCFCACACFAFEKCIKVSLLIQRQSHSTGTRECRRHDAWLLCPCTPCFLLQYRMCHRGQSRSCEWKICAQVEGRKSAVGGRSVQMQPPQQKPPALKASWLTGCCSLAHTLLPPSLWTDISLFLIKAQH